MEDTTSIVTVQQHLAKHDRIDAIIIISWLHGLSEHTQRAYRGDVEKFQAYVRKPLASVTLIDLQAYADSLTSCSPASKARMLHSLKSLLTFAHTNGQIPFNVGGALRIKKHQDKLSERIISESQAQRMVHVLEPDELPTSSDAATLRQYNQEHRNHCILSLLYATGLRSSELATLKWKDAVEHRDGGILNVFGKGGRTRAVNVPAAVWGKLVTMKGTDDAPVFRSAKGGHLTTVQIGRIVKDAASKAKIKKPVSTHWMRHAHVSHALDNGAQPHVVMASVGHASLVTTSRYTHVRPASGSSAFIKL